MKLKQKMNLLKRWVSMLTGKSVFHVEQKVGKVYSKEEIRGYYNDLTGKVLGNTLLDNQQIPINKTANEQIVYFPITIFQYALGAYDLYLLTNEEGYKEKFLIIVNWALEKQNSNGSWNCFDQLGDTKHEPFSAMCQGEGASVLSRAYILTKEEKYYNAAIKAIEFMTIDIKNGGTTTYKENDVIFQEYVSAKNTSVLNGWIFAIFGLYDVVKMSKSKKYLQLLNLSLETLIRKLEEYDTGEWTNYDLQGTVASPAYHDLHIQQLEVLYELFDKKDFFIYSQKWTNYQKNNFLRRKAFIKKAIQKIFNSKYDSGTSLIG